MSELVRGGVLAVLMVLQELLRHSLGSVFAEGSLYPALISGTSTVALFLLFALYSDRLRSIKWLRHRIWFLSEFEGFWISNVSDPTAPFSISKVYYSNSGNCWIHHGIAYDPKGNAIRQWLVSSIHFDKKSKEWYFDGKWWDLQTISNAKGSEPQRGNPHDQISLWLVTKSKRNRQVTLYFDDPRSAGMPIRQADMPRSGRGEMCFVPTDRLRGIVGKEIENIEDVSPRMAKLIKANRAALFKEFIEAD